MIRRTASYIAIFSICLSGQAFSQSSREIPLDSTEKLELRNVKADFVTYRGYPAVRITDIAPPGAGDDDRLAIVKGTSFADGTIEVALAGDTAEDAPASRTRFCWNRLSRGRSFPFRALLHPTQEWQI
jgi:hypothetical protein